MKWKKTSNDANTIIPCVAVVILMKQWRHFALSDNINIYMTCFIFITFLMPRDEHVFDQNGLNKFCR